MRMVCPSGWAALRSRVRTLLPSDWSKVRWARWTAIMLMVPVAHFWTSASGRDTVTSCEGFTFADGLIIETRRRFVQFGNCPRCRQSTDRSYMVILTPYYSKPRSDCRLRPIQDTIFFSFIFNTLLSFPQAKQPFLRKIFHKPLSFCGII